MSCKISVVHLVWLPYGIDFFERFLKSYTANKTTVQHELVFLFNGVKNEKDIDDYLQLAKIKELKFIYFYLQKGQDLDAYTWVAKQLKTEYVLFLNSYSKVLKPNWLNVFENNFTESIGLLSATGSYQSYYSSVFQKNKWYYELDKNFVTNIRKYKLFLKAFLYWRFCFNKFPAKHLRTNAFMISRKLFIENIFFRKPIKNKFDAYKIESGKNSITNQIIKLGLNVAIVGADGKKYNTEEWKNCKIFWQANQENLLIEDNQTNIYRDASKVEKVIMTKLAWGN